MKTSICSRAALPLILAIAALAVSRIVLPQDLSAAAAGQPLIGGVPAEEALRLGERMYVNGILPSGKPMQAMVQGDIPVEGSQFTCANCHQRSGFGSREGLMRTSPIDGSRLYAPVSKFKGIPRAGVPDTTASGDELYRPAYTDETLARAMLTGETPAGRQMSDAMPKYFLNENDMAILVYYLKNLSTGMEPGVTDTDLRFATVVAGDVPREQREAMLRPLQMLIANFGIPKSAERMMRGGMSIREGRGHGLRKLSLSVWELTGPAETWRKQLEERYAKEPVFAFLGGMTTGVWEPVHRFCEDHEIPAVFPVIDIPVLSTTDWYTLYFSRGFALEGETAARFLSRNDELRDRPVVQVFRDDRTGRTLASAFREARQELGAPAPLERTVADDEKMDARFWKRLAAAHPQATAVLWLDSRDFPDLEALGRSGAMPRTVIASATLLGPRLFALTEKERASVYLTYPVTLPQAARNYQASLETQLRNAKGPLSGQFIDEKMQVLRSVLSTVLVRMRSYPYRNYFLEVIDELGDQTLMPVPYPYLSFGPGQRYASKGCYVVQVSGGEKPQLLDKSGWITY